MFQQMKEKMVNHWQLLKISKILSLISGQKPKITRAQKSIASFKIRENDEIGAVVTLRGKKCKIFFSS